MAFGSEPMPRRDDEDPDDDAPRATSFRRDDTLWLVFATQRAGKPALHFSHRALWRMWDDGELELCAIKNDGGVDSTFADALFLGVEDRLPNESVEQAQHRLRSQCQRYMAKAKELIRVA